MKYTNILLIIVLLVISFLSSCGIPNIPYIVEPEVVYTAIDLDTGEKSVTFYNASENDPSYFEGYILYYKFFATEDDIEKSQEEHENDDDRSDLLNDDFFFLYRVQKESEGVYSYIESPMTIELEDSQKNSSFRIVLDFNGDITETALFGTTITYDNTKFSVGRFIEQNRQGSTTEDPVLKSFRKTEFSEDDEDLPDTYGNYIYIAVYVLSFGKDSEAGFLYSEPVFLGNFELEVSAQ